MASTVVLNTEASKNLPNIPQLVNSNPQAAAILAKLNTSQSANQKPYSAYNFEEIAKSTASRLRNNESITQLLPDLEIAIQIMTACILDPNGMLDNTIVYKAPSINMTSNVMSLIINTIKKYIASNYDVEENLPKIIREALFTKGAYVEAIIPEASLDRLINNNPTRFNQESAGHMLRSINLSLDLDMQHTLGRPTVWEMNTEAFKATYSTIGTDNKALEKFTKRSNGMNVVQLSESDLGFEITDNYSILASSKYVLKQMQNNQRKKYGLNTNLESEDKESYLDTLFRNNSSLGWSDTEMVLRYDETARDSIGKPLVLKLPVESVIPIFASNNPSMHIGYFVLVDELGRPLDIVSELEALDDSDACGNRTGQAKDMKTALIHRAKHGLFGALKDVPKVQDMEVLYNDIVDHMIKSRLRNSDFEDLVDIKESADIYRVMLNRALAAKKTKLLYLPVDLVQYYAFDYRSNGTGASLLERTLVLVSMAGMLLYANVKSSIQSAVPITDINITLDEQDTNPLATAEAFLSEMIRANNVSFPLGMTDPLYLQDWVIRSGFRTKITSPYLPNMEIDRSTETGVRGDVIDSSRDTYNNIVGMIVKSLSMSPEIIEQGYKEDFAATVLAKNKLFAKRVIQFQNQLMPMITDHIRKILVNDPIIGNEIKEVVISNKDAIKKGLKAYKATQEEDVENLLDNIKDKDLADYVLKIFQTSLKVELPSPSFGDENEKASALSGFMSSLDTVLDSIYVEGMFDNTNVGKGTDVIDKVKSMVKSGLIQEWLIENNYMTNVLDWYTKQDDGTLKDPLLENNLVFASSVLKEYINYINKNLTETNKLNKAYEKVENKLENMGIEDEGSGDDYGSDDSSSDDMDDSDGMDSDTMDEGSDMEATDDGMEESSDDGSEEETEEEPAAEDEEELQ